MKLEAGKLYAAKCGAVLEYVRDSFFTRGNVIAKIVRFSGCQSCMRKKALWDENDEDYCLVFKGRHNVGGQDLPDWHLHLAREIEQ